TLEVAKMDYWSAEIVEGVLNDFYELCLTQKVISEGGVEYAREVLEKAFGSQQANVLFDKITKQLKTKAFSFVRKADYKNLLAIVQNEHPQTIALILSYSRSDQASAILSELPKDVRIEVVERIARMDAASPDVVKSIEETLERKFASIVSMDSMEVGGVNYIADVLNNVDRATEKFIFDELALRDPKLAEEIRQKMFVFEDITILDPMSIQAFLKEVDPKDLAVAIKGSSGEVAEIIYANMSTRMKETTQTDVEYLRNVRMKDVEESQQRIVAIIRRLEDEGVLTISKGGGDEIIA
ncbi:MAG: flagellar motor switch protein FliG, partial [Oscillospiraceae bacterium]|nr:flagellar motor switch protein FliG [Oscillospiraceae bacterium]